MREKEEEKVEKLVLISYALITDFIPCFPLAFYDKCVSFLTENEDNESMHDND